MSNNVENNKRIVRIKLVDGTQINGQVNIDKGAAGYDRLSDLIQSTNEEFLVVVNARAYLRGFEDPIRKEVMFVNKRHILWATPETDER